MKRVIKKFFLAVAIFISMIATAEAQNSFAYQAVIRTAQGKVVSNQKVGMRFSLIYNEKTVYSETHTPETNQYGNVQVEVGKGQKVSGSFDAVPWSTMQVMMKIEADPNGGTNYIDLGTIQLQPVPYAMYAPTAGTVSTVQASEPKSESDALFEVKDKDGNVVFAVYPDVVRVFVDDSDSTANKAMQTGFAVSGRRAAKEGGDANIFAVNTDGTQVFVGEKDTTGGKPLSTGFAVSGRRAAKDGSADLFTVSSTGTQIYIGEQDGKPIATGFAVSGRRAAKDGSLDNYLEINSDGTRVFIDDADSASGKPIATGFAVSGRRAAKDDADSKYFEINANGTQVFVDDPDSYRDGDKPIATGFAVSGRRAAKGSEPKLFEVNQYGTKIYIDTKKGKPLSTGFAVSGRRASKEDSRNQKYMVIDADGTRIYVDYEEAKAMQTGFAVSGRRAAKDGTPNTILEVNNVDGTRVYIDDIDGKAMQTGFAVSGRRAAKDDNNFLDINSNKITLANKQLAVGNTTTDANTLVMTGESTTIVTDVFLVAEKETEEPLLIADNTSGVGVNTNLVVRGEVSQNVETEEIEEAVPDTIMVASEIKTLSCTELTAALGEADGYALLKIHGNGLFTLPQEADAAGNTSILFDVNGKMTSFRDNAVVAVIMTNAATPDAKVLIWPLKQTNSTCISFGLITAGVTDQYVNVLACINAKGGVECKFNAIASDSNIGEVKVEGTKVYGDVVRIEATTIKKGYHFAGWSDGVETNPRSVMVAGDSTITALFEPNPYNVTLTATNGHIEGAESGIFHYGTKLTLEAIADDHYHFVYWSNGSTDNPYTLEVENNLELTANFEINKYIVTFDANGGVFAEGAASTSKVTYNRPIGAFPAVERKGYIFTGWADYKGDSFVEETLVTDTVKLYAQWLQTTYYVADADNNGSANGDGTSGNPYASIYNALEEMITKGTDTVYTICVKGTLAEQVVIEDLNGKIRRLIIEGDGGQMEIDESTGESQYVPGGTLTVPEDVYNSVLVVATTVPVTLRNINVTGANTERTYDHGAGVCVASYATVTIDENTYVYDNEAHPECGYGGGIAVYGKLVMVGGCIRNNSSYYGGGVTVYECGVFEMRGGSIVGNNADQGGGVYVKGQFTMTGGTINCNTDGAVYVSSNGTFRMGGSAYIPFGVYYDNEFATNRGDNDVQLCSSNGKAANITIISDLTEQTPVATFTTEDYTSKVLCAYSKENDVEEDVTLLKNNYTKFTIMPRYYYSIFPHYYDYEILDNGQLQHNCPVKFYYDENSTEPHGEPFTLIEGDNLTAPEQRPTKDGYQFLGWHRRKRVSWFDYEIATDSLEFPYTVGYEDDSIVLVGQWAQNVFYVKQDGNDSNGGTNSTDDALASIDGAVRKMCNDKVDYTIVVSGTLKGIQTIADQIIENVDSHSDPFTINPIIANKITLCGDTIDSDDDIIDGGWFLDDSGSETEPNNRYGNEMREGSALTINTAVPVIIKKLTITGGFVLGGNGGGIYASNSNIEIGNGALITDNYCSMNLDTEVGGYGGGVYLAPNAQLSLIIGGQITVNQASYGGGVCVDQNATFNMRGGQITGNSAFLEGGGVYVAENATFNMSGNGQITSNESFMDGGGISNYGSLSIINGTIGANSASNNGGGIYNEGSLTMTGGTIGGEGKGNTAGVNGGGICSYSEENLIGGTSEECRPEISYNTATNDGGGVASVEAGRTIINIGNALISNNTAQSRGGGLYQGEWAQITITDGALITGNKAREGSGFSHCDSPGSPLVMEGGTINGCANIDMHSIQMSGNAEVDTISLNIHHAAKVVIAGELKSSKKAVILPSEYRNGLQLVVDRQFPEDEPFVSNDVFASALGKFTVAPYKVDESTTLNCYITNDGKLLMDVNIGEVIRQIREATKYGDISVVGMMPENGIARIGDALRGKNEDSPEVEIALDLSGVSGMDTIPGSEERETTNFKSCLNLVSITLPDGITRIDSSAFKGCGYLAAVNIPEGVESIGNKAFEGCYLSEGITLPASVTSIGERCFAVCSFKSIIIPDGVKTISKYTFANCENLESIVLPQIDIVDESAFKNCENLATVYFKGSQVNKENINIKNDDDNNTSLVEAEWVYNYYALYVSQDGSDENSGLSASEPLATFGGETGALAKIDAIRNYGNNYYIYIDGVIEGYQTIPADARALTITICGLNDLGDGIPGDELRGYGDGTTLSIGNSNKVAIKNLKITGGGSNQVYQEYSNCGVYVATAEATLENVRITDNKYGLYNGSGARTTIKKGTVIRGNAYKMDVTNHPQNGRLIVEGGSIQSVDFDYNSGWSNPTSLKIGGDVIIDTIYVKYYSSTDGFDIESALTQYNSSKQIVVNIDCRNTYVTLYGTQLLKVNFTENATTIATEAGKFKYVDDGYYLDDRGIVTARSVDLGVSKEWAAVNLRAIAPHRLGEYFAWGETVPKRDYAQGTYDYYVNDIQTLPSDKDAATVLWGEEWTMPTKEDICELLQDCYWSWTTNYKNTNVKGYIIYKSDNKDLDYGTNHGSEYVYSIEKDNHIFLPAWGYQDGETIKGEGSKCEYWSMTSFYDEAGDTTHARGIIVDSNSNGGDAGVGLRWEGRPIRAVKKQN